MTDTVKQFAPQIRSAIQDSKHALLHCHPSPDPDSIGSSLALNHLLKNLGKKVTHISGDSKLPSSLHLPGIENILLQNFVQTDLSQIDLFISLDSSNIDQITKAGPVVFPATLKTINIDHHTSNTKYAQINLVDSTYPAVGQILYDLMKFWQVQITPDIAICLFMAIWTDTWGFQYAPVNYETLLAGAELAKINPTFPQVLFDYQNSNSKGRILFRGLAFLSAKSYFSGQIAITCIPYTQLQEYGISKEDTEKNDAENELKSVIGCNIGVKLVEKDPGRVTFSFRTRDPLVWDVAKLAVEIGGGGNPAASGATVQGSMDQALEKLLAAIQKIYPQLGKP